MLRQPANSDTTEVPTNSILTHVSETGDLSFNRKSDVNKGVDWLGWDKQDDTITLVAEFRKQ